MKKYNSFSEWGVVMMSSTKELGKSFWCFAKTLVAGIVSLSVAVWNKLIGIVERNAAGAVITFLMTTFLVWLVTFVSLRTRAVGAESQRDSISYEYSQFKERYGFE